MKKIICFILLAAMLTALCGCETIKKLDLPPVPTVTPTPVQTPAPDEPEAAPAPTETPEEPTAPVDNGVHPVIVRFKNTELEGYDPQNGEKLILRFSYDTVNISIDGRPEAAEKINEYAATLSEAYYTGEDFGNGFGTGYLNLLTAAEDDYNYRISAGIEGDMYEYTSSQSIAVARADSDELTLVFNEYSYMGGAHGSYASRGYCFDTRTGEMIGLRDLGADYESLKAALLDFMVETTENDEQLQESISLMEGSDYRETLEPIIRDGSWYFDESGLVIFSDLYEISSYAAGPISYCVPYSELRGMIDDRWIPEGKTATGTIRLVPMDELENGSISILDKVKIDDSGDEFCLVAEGKVYNAALTMVNFSDAFYDREVRWYCSELENAAVQVVEQIPDGMPNLKISWTDADGGHNNYVSESGMDGTLILVGDDIAAVG